MNPYQEFVRIISESLKAARNFPLGGFRPPDRRPVEPDAPVGVIFSPHPDDECINGGMALRLLREAGFRIVNVPVTLGSDPARRDARRDELANACGFLGFEVRFAGPGGFSQIDPDGRESNPQNWDSAVALVTELLERLRPDVVFYPHRFDRHPVHCGTHLLVTDALSLMPDDFACLTIETEYWQAQESPNLLVELDAEIVGDLVAALSFHRGEVERSPYHLSLPAWMIDNVRRGSEIVGSTGGAAPGFGFSVLHKISLFAAGHAQPALGKSRILSAKHDLSAFFEESISAPY